MTNWGEHANGTPAHAVPPSGGYVEPLPAGAHPCHVDGCPGHCRYVDDEYGSLAAGGSYEIWSCDACGHRVYSALPD